jgi:protein O-mannosyl-transferase
VGFLRKKWLTSLILFLIASGVYFPSLRNHFVWDDIETIENSYYVFKVSSIGSIIVPAHTDKKESLYYRPLIYMSMVLDKGIWGISGFGFHLSNIFFNALTTVCFYLLMLLLFREFKSEAKDAVAFMAGVLFAFYPMHVESVSWVSGRTDVLCALFFFLAFIFHILSLRRPLITVLAAACFLLSLMSKEVAVVFPLIVLVFDVLGRRRWNRHTAATYAAYAGLLAVFLYIRGRGFVDFPEISHVRVLGDAPVPGSVSGIVELLGVIKVILVSYLYYFLKLVFPFRFNAVVESVPAGHMYVIASILLLCIIALSVSYSIIKKDNISGFSLIWILATLFPSVLVALSETASAPVAERYLYIPSAGFCLLIGSMLVYLGRSFGQRKVSLALAFLLAGSYLFFTIHRQAVWKDRLSLWGDTVEKSPRSSVPHINYGLALLDAGREDEALRELLKNFEKGVIINDSGRSVTANNIGVVYVSKEDIPNAERWFLKAYGYDPGYYKTSYHLGLINYLKGKSGGSTDDYRISGKYIMNALKIRPLYGKAYLLLAMVNLELGEKEKARRNAELAIKSGLTDTLARQARGIMETPD